MGDFFSESSFINHSMQTLIAEKTRFSPEAARGRKARDPSLLGELHSESLRDHLGLLPVSDSARPGSASGFSLGRYDLRYLVGPLRPGEWTGLAGPWAI